MAHTPNGSGSMAAQSVHIRPAIGTDLECIARVQAQAMVAAPYYDDAVDEEDEFRRLRPRILGYFDGSYHPSFSEADRTVVVADCQGVVGFGAGHVSIRLSCSGELQWLFVLPQWQGQGIGTALVKSLAEWFGRLQSTRVIVDAPPDHPSRAFYVSQGAVPLDAYWLHWPDIGESCSV